jgi:urease subunit alpha
MPDETMRGTPSDMSAPHNEDKVPLAGTGLFVEVEKDFTVSPGAADAGVRAPLGAGHGGPGEGAADTVIAGAVILDYWGIVRADVGLREGRIVGIGRAGDPAAGPDDVDIVVGPATRMIDAAGRILTAGIIDAFVPRIGSQQVEAALAAGVTTLLASPPATPWNLAAVLAIAGDLPVNLALPAAGGASSRSALAKQVAAGAPGLVLDAGREALAAIDDCLAVADTFDVQLTVRTDGDSAPTLVDAIAARAGRTLHTCHVSGWSPALAKLCGLSAALPSSTLGHPGDNAPHLALLHDIGALSMIVSGSNDPGNIVATAFATAAAMKTRRGPLPEALPGNDNFRVRRYLAKVTINPAIAHGLDEWVGSIEIGKLADLALWSPTTFGVRPDMVIKLGTPVPSAGPSQSCVFVSQASLGFGAAGNRDSGHVLLPVRNTRSVSKESMVHNSALPVVEVDPATGALRIDGEPLVTLA